MKHSAFVQKCALWPVIACLLAPTTPIQAQTTTPTGTTTPIQHVVVIFQENVSFDHYFATYPVAQNKTIGEPQFKAAAGTPPVNGLSGPLLTNNPNSAQPFRLGRNQSVTCDQDHNYADEQKAVNSGLMNKFVESVGSSSASCDINNYGKTIVMSYYDGNTVTGFWNYAQNYAMSDNFYDTQFGPSSPGALNVISGNTTGTKIVSGSATNYVVGDSMIGDARPAGDDCNPANTTTATMSGKNIGDLLNTKNLTWGWFQGGFKPTAVTGGVATCGATHNNISGASAGSDYIAHHAAFQYYVSTQNLHHLPPTSVANIGKTDQANHNYDMSDFNAALAAGNLPAVSYLKAGAYQDGHAGYSDPLDEQQFVVGVVNSIMQSPFWSSTAIFITYDDSDGWYDHQMSPIVNQSNSSSDNLTGPGNCGDGSVSQFQGRCGYGPRLPFLTISPYAKVNYVDHTVTDQASVVRFIEDNWNLGRIGNGSMDVVAGTLNSMFNFDTPAAGAVLLDPKMGIVTGQAAGGGSTSPTGTTKAIANPKNLSTTLTQIQLDGSQSTSFDGKALTYAWSVAPGSYQTVILNPADQKPLVQLVGGPGVYTYNLIVTDSSGKTATDSVTVYVP